MTTPELIEFVKAEIAKGVSKDIIRNKLVEEGWSDIDIVEVYCIIESKMITMNKVPSPFLSAANVCSNIGHSNTKKYIKYSLVIFILFFLLTGGILAYGSTYFSSVSKIFSKLKN